MSIACYCNSGKTFAECCEPFITGAANPPTAEACLRSRYSAYVLGNADYILDTIEPEERKRYDRKGIEKWSKNSQWISLQVLSSKDEGDEGNVEFVATFKENFVTKKHHEKSVFTRIDGKWCFKSGVVVPPATFVRETALPGRNDPCTCGSGKKFKKCCGK